MVRVTVNVNRGGIPAAPNPLGRDIVFGLTGTTTHRPSDGASYTVPRIGDMFLLQSEADHARGGTYSDGTLGKALAAIEAHGDWRVAGVRHDEGALEFYAGTSMDATVEAAELDIVGTNGQAVIESYNGSQYHLIAVLATEPDITRVFYSSNPGNNVVRSFTKAGDTFIPAGDTRPHNVWVSNAASAMGANDTITVGILTAVDAMEKLEDAEAAVAYAPNRIITADRMHNVSGAGVVDNTAANALVTKMAEVCASLEALGYANGPGSSDVDFVGWLASNYSEYLAGCAPYATLAGETAEMPMGPIWAAAHARRTRGGRFWLNPHGADVSGVHLLSRPITYDPSRGSSSSSVITAANGVSMFQRSGFHLLGGGLMVNPDDDDALQRITSRLIVDDVRRHSATAGSRGAELNVGPDLFDFASNIVRNRLQFLAGQRAINSFSVAPDTAANTPESLAAGDVHFDVQFDVVKNPRNLIFNLFYT